MPVDAAACPTIVTVREPCAFEARGGGQPIDPAFARSLDHRIPQGAAAD
jgi:hypothetical protein